MTIKTAVTLATGAAVGFFLGCCQPEDTKEKIVSNVKDWIVYALTGEHIKKKPRIVVKPVAYEKKDIPEKEKIKPAYDWYILKDELLEFDSHEDADSMLKIISKKIEEFGYVTVSDIAYAKGVHPKDYTWDKFGWDEKDASSMRITDAMDPLRIGTGYKILVPSPHLI